MRKKAIYLLIVNIFFAFFFHACFPLKPTPNSIDFQQIYQSYNETPSEEFANYIARYEEKRKIATPEGRLVAYLNLAALYFHHKNPQPDFAKALTLIEQSIAMSKDSLLNENLKTYQRLLKKIMELETEVKFLNKKIEQLEETELQMEKIRREHK